MYCNYPGEAGRAAICGSNNQLADGLVRLVYHCGVSVDYTWNKVRQQCRFLIPIKQCKLNHDIKISSFKCLVKSSERDNSQKKQIRSVYDDNLTAS